MSAPVQPPLGLNLPRRRALSRADFIESPANADAAAMVCAPSRWPGRRLALVGPAGSGKTHLVHVLMAETGAARIEASALTAPSVPALVAAGTVAVEGADRLAEAPDASAALFHLLNLAQAEAVPVLLSGRSAPSRWETPLPDLASRLAAVTPVALALPDDLLLEGVIAKLLADRHLRFQAELPAYLAARIERSFAAAERVVDRLDAASLAERRSINRDLARVVLGNDPLDDAP